MKINVGLPQRPQQIHPAIPFIITAGFFIGLFVYIMDSTSPSNPQPSQEELSLEELETLVDEQPQTEAQDAPEFLIEDLEEGTGDEATVGDTVRVHYTGTFLDGTTFDSSLDRGEPYELTIGAGSVIQGWEEGLPGMKVGGKRKLTIPSSMGYGVSGSGSIPPNAGLVFEVQLVEIVE